MAQILAAVEIAARQGLRCRWSTTPAATTASRRSPSSTASIDIYMPDMKYGDARLARKLLARRATTSRRTAQPVKEMHRQVGDLVTRRAGNRAARPAGAASGAARRHRRIRTRSPPFWPGEVSRGTYVNIMDQYRPCYRADEYPQLDQALAHDEYEAALAAAARHGLRRFDRRCPAPARARRHRARRASRRPGSVRCRCRRCRPGEGSARG
ncbi:MAG: hypothetical protein MZW92_15460 [Comamonadaceae bacterium]|nr:hypothetical protein [Comamonadaceae bacterium]